MTSYATVLLIFSPPNWGNTAQSAAQIGATGIADCTAALSDLSDRFWMRRVSLLRARAIHRLETQDVAGALADLDVAAAAAHDDDAFYTRSLGLGLKLTQAYALRLKGDQAQADAIAAAALQARPYNRQVSLSALIAIGPAGNVDVRRTALHSLIRLSPVTAELVYEQSFDAMMFDDVVALYPVFLDPSTIGHGETGGRSGAARRAGMYAYALAALGRNAEARAAIAAARQRLATVPVESASTAADGEDTSQGPSHPPAQNTGAPVNDPILTAWQMAVEWRIQIAEGRYADVLKVLHAANFPKGAMAMDLVKALAAAVPPKLKSSVPALDAFRPALPADETAMMLATFFKSLPGPETAHNLPSFSDSNWLDSNGASVETEGDRIKIKFRGGDGTLTVMEEMALLKAAEMARAAGKTGIMVLARHDTRYTLTTTYYGNPLRTDPNGFSTELTVVFVDPATQSDADKAVPWRTIDAGDVITQLEPVYRPGRKAH